MSPISSILLTRNVQAEERLTPEDRGERGEMVAELVVELFNNIYLLVGYIILL
jgi:hypothetical protein